MSELNVSNTNVEVLETIDPSITVINCSTNRLEELPELPPGLLVLNCSHNPLNELPTLPVSIQSVDCAFTHIRVLILPPTLLNLTNLRCDWCDLVAIPVLPPNVTEFNCSNNPMDALSEPLPQGLLTLICCNCYLERLPELPNSLLHLECEHNVIRELPSLPTGLRNLLCVDNMIEGLPELPNSLLELECDHNEIRELPALPDGIETVNCSFNHIRELPALPDSLEDFNFTRNPLTLASFNMLRETFPFQEFNPSDYPEGFMDPVGIEPDPEPEEPEEEPELTEGDHIEARNIAIQQEVHEAFDKINVSKLYPVIDSEDTPTYHPGFLFDYIRQLVHGNTLDAEEHARIISLFEQFTENIRNTFYTCITDAATQRLISTVLTYVSRQNREFKNNYVRFLIDDISSAYEFNPEIPDLATASCAKGIKERIIMSLKSATIGQSEAYQPLLRAFIHKIPIDIMREFTSACMEDARVKELLETEPTPKIDEKVRILSDCIREKLQTTEYFPVVGAEEVPDPPEFTAYIATLRYGIEGGKTTRKRNKKKTRKLKSKKTKRKIKKNKLSKKRNK
jgi:Leucine-rich repeat (LRR) protein